MPALCRCNLIILLPISNNMHPTSSSSRACPILARAYSRFHCPLPPFTILSPLPSWNQADVEWPQVLFNGTEPSSSRSTGRSFPIAWQSRNNGSKNTCMVHSAVGPRDMTKKRRRLSRRVVDSWVWHVRWSTSTFVTWRVGRKVAKVVSDTTGGKHPTSSRGRRLVTVSLQHAITKY